MREERGICLCQNKANLRRRSSLPRLGTSVGQVRHPERWPSPSPAGLRLPPFLGERGRLPYAGGRSASACRSRPSGRGVREDSLALRQQSRAPIDRGEAGTAARRSNRGHPARDSRARRPRHGAGGVAGIRWRPGGFRSMGVPPMNRRAILVLALPPRARRPCYSWARCPCYARTPARHATGARVRHGMPAAPRGRRGDGN
jgi:hypothetical protein